MNPTVETQHVARKILHTHVDSKSVLNPDGMDGVILGAFVPPPPPPVVPIPRIPRQTGIPVARNPAAAPATRALDLTPTGAKPGTASGGW